MGINNWVTNARVWGEPVSVRDVHFKPQGSKGPQITATVFDATGSRLVKSWNLPAAQVLLLVTAASEVTLRVRVSGKVEAAAGGGALMLSGITPIDPKGSSAEPGDSPPAAASQNTTRCQVFS